MGFTKNFKVWQQISMLAKTNSYIQLPKKMIDVVDNEYTQLMLLTGQYSMPTSSLFYVSGNSYITQGSYLSNFLWIGSNSGEENESDTKITPITTNITAGSPTSVLNRLDGKMEIGISQTFTNSSTEDVTVNEIGYFKAIPKENSSTNCPIFLLYRKKLDTPFKILANGGKYTANLVFTLNSEL